MSAIKYSFAAGAAVIAMLTACGDDVTNVTEVNEKAAIDLVEKYKELPKCEDSLYGTLIYAADSSQVYACTSDGWASLKGEKGDQGDDGLDGEDGKNGEDGENGKDGEDGTDGENGTSCTANQLSDGSGYNIVCGGKTVGTITNGTNGTDGEDGTSCNIVSDENGVVVIQCGEGENAETTKLYKAMCGADPFDPADKFCYAAELYNLCGGKVYDPSKYYCSDEVVYDRCNGNEYDHETLFCARFADSTEQLYKMMKFGDQTWMAENLNYETESSYCYDNNDENCTQFGRLYTWAAANEACPEGWHLPSQTEWETLIIAADGNISEYTDYNLAGLALKSAEGWDNAGNDTLAIGFSALPAGIKDYESDVFNGIDSYTYFWTSTGKDTYSAYYVKLSSSNNQALIDYADKSYGYSIRCLKN